jgi:hypothetical protein
MLGVVLLASVEMAAKCWFKVAVEIAGLLSTQVED